MTDIGFILLGTFMLAVTAVGSFMNGFVVWAFLSRQRLRTINNSFAVCMSLDNLLMIFLSFPQVISSSFDHHWFTGHTGCVVSAFCTTVAGLSQITLLTVVAVDRYLIIVRQVRLFSKNVATVVASMTSCFLYSTGWALGPLFGWSRYELEIGGISCSVSWRLKEAGNLSYTMCLFTFVWFIPLMVVVFCYSNILCLVNRKKLVVRQNSQQDKRASSREWKVSITVLLMIGAFVISWMPYSVVSFWSVFDDVTETTVLIPAILAKSSVIWNPIIYLSRHRDFRKCLIDTVCACVKKDQIEHDAKQTHKNNMTQFETQNYSTSPTVQRECGHGGRGCKCIPVIVESLLPAEPETSGIELSSTCSGSSATEATSGGTCKEGSPCLRLIASQGNLEVIDETSIE